MSVPSLHAREHAGHIQLTEQLYRARSTHRSVPIRSDGVPDYRQVGYQKACPPLTTLPVPGSISGSARGHVLTSASGSYRSICAAGAIDQSQELSTQNNGHERQPAIARLGISTRRRTVALGLAVEESTAGRRSSGLDECGSCPRAAGCRALCQRD